MRVQSPPFAPDHTSIKCEQDGVVCRPGTQPGKKGSVMLDYIIIDPQDADEKASGETDSLLVKTWPQRIVKGGVC